MERHFGIVKAELATFWPTLHPGVCGLTVIRVPSPTPEMNFVQAILQLPDRPWHTRWPVDWNSPPCNDGRFRHVYQPCRRRHATSICQTPIASTRFNPRNTRWLLLLPCRLVIWQLEKWAHAEEYRQCHSSALLTVPPAITCGLEWISQSEIVT